VDADGLIDRNRALVALAEQTCRGSLEAAALAREVRRSAAETHDRAVQIICQSSVIRRLSSLTISAGKGTPVSPQYVQRLKAEAEELLARVRGHVAAVEGDRRPIGTAYAARRPRTGAQ